MFSSIPSKRNLYSKKGICIIRDKHGDETERWICSGRRIPSATEQHESGPRCGLRRRWRRSGQPRSKQVANGSSVRNGSQQRAQSRDASTTSNPRSRNERTNSSGAPQSVTMVWTCSRPQSAETERRPNLVLSKQKITRCAARIIANWISMSNPCELLMPGERYPARAHHGHIRVDLGEGLHGQRPDQNAQTRINHTAGEHQFNPRGWPRRNSPPATNW